MGIRNRGRNEGTGAGPDEKPGEEGIQRKMRGAEGHSVSREMDRQEEPG